MRGVASAILGTGAKFMPLPSAHVHSTSTLDNSLSDLNFAIGTHYGSYMPSSLLEFIIISP